MPVNLLVLVMDDLDKVHDVLEAWERAGVPGVTMLDSIGSKRLGDLGRDDLPLLVSLRAMLSGQEMPNRVLFSVIDIAENHNMYYYNLVVQHRFTERCASIRNINYPLPRPPLTDEPGLHLEKAKALKGEPSEAVEAAVREAVAAIEEDGAEVITFGCSASFWLRPFVEKRLHEMGWEIPVLEGYSCAIELAKAMVNLKIDVSGLLLPGDRPKKWRRKKTF